MKTASAGLVTHLGTTNKFIIADLYQITPAGSLVNMNLNPGFLLGTSTYPTNWAEYNNSSGLEPITPTRVLGGPNGVDYYEHQVWSVNNTTTKGITGAMTYTPLKQYQVAFQARATGTNVGQAMGLFWNTSPASTITDANPGLTTSWQAYVFRITWGASVDPSNFISIANGSGTQGSLDIAQVVITDCATTMRWTSADQDIIGYSSSGPVIHHSGLRQVRGTEIPDLSVTLDVGNIGTQPTINGVTLPLAAIRGAFDGALFRMDRMFMPTSGDISLGILPKFYGIVTAAQPGSTIVKLTIAGELKKLNMFQLPRVVYQPSCMHALYDAGCGVTKVPVSTTIASGTTASSVVVNNASATGTWDLGTIKLANGEFRSIRTSTLSGGTNILLLNVPLLTVPTITNAATLLVGCDKALTTCNTKFSNIQRFRGFPYIPKPENAR